MAVSRTNGRIHRVHDLQSAGREQGPQDLVARDRTLTDAGVLDELPGREGYALVLDDDVTSFVSRTPTFFPAAARESSFGSSRYMVRFVVERQGLRDVALFLPGETRSRSSRASRGRCDHINTATRAR